MRKRTQDTHHLLRLALLAAVGLVLFGCAEAEVPTGPDPVRPVKLMTAGGGNSAEIARSFPGRVEAANQVDLSFRVGGPLVELPVKEGQTVAKGELLARIDPRDFEIRLRSARAQAERADADLTRFSALYEKDAVSGAQLDQAQAARDVAGAALEDAEADLADSQLKAPFGGSIGKVMVENFQDVRSKEPILSLVDFGQVEIVVDVPEGLIARRDDEAPPGELVARFEAAPDREFPLTVGEVSAQADPRTQTYRATLVMDQPRGLNVLPGMTATVVYKPTGTEQQAAEVLVPASAVFADESGAAHVWVVDTAAMTVSRRAVVTGGLAGSDQVEIREGLAAGETIAASATSRLRDGMQIRPLEPQG